MRTLDAWYAHTSVEQINSWISAEVRQRRLGRQEAKEAAEDIAKARTRDSVRVFARRTAQIDGELRIVRDPRAVDRGQPTSRADRPAGR